MPELKKDYKNPVTISELRDFLNQLDSSYDNIPVGRPDGGHEYWGGLFTSVRSVVFKDESINGPKQNAVHCLLLD